MTIGEVTREALSEMGLSEEEIKERIQFASVMMPGLVNKPVLFKPGVNEAEAKEAIKATIKSIFALLKNDPVIAEMTKVVLISEIHERQKKN